ncbi:MAG: cysteine desulfurase family protein [Planctomycetota bacterium]
MEDTIYLDHNATTPTRPEVVEAVTRCYRDGYANPASQHRPGQQARRELDEAREAIAAILGADLSGSSADRLIFTSGGTEANSLAVLGIARARAGAQPGHLIVSAAEHASVIEPAEHLLEKGWRVDQLGVSGDGVVRVDRLPSMLRSHTSLVSVMLGSHETGVLQPVSQLVPICRDAGVPLHTDAVQVAGKLPIDFRSLGVSAMTVAAHKFQGPLGIGALILADGVPIEPLFFGGHQQDGLRPGTESVALAVGMKVALQLWQKEHQAHARKLAALRERLEAGLRAGFPGLVVNGSGADRLPHTASIAFPGLDGQILLVALDTVGVACSVGSACSSGSTELSPTLRAMGLPHEVIAGSLRFSLGATTTQDEIDEAVRRILGVVGELA